MTSEVIDVVLAPPHARLPMRDRALARVATHGRSRVPAVATAAAVALLPLLEPRGPVNMAPVDAFIAVAIAAAVFWAISTRQVWRFPYALAMSLFIAGGAIGAMAGPVPSVGLSAVLQDMVLLVLSWVVVNVAASRDHFRLLGRVWAYASIAWAAVLLAGIVTATPALTGRVAREGTRTALTFGDPNISANYYFISIMIISAFRCPRHRLPRYAAYGLLLGALATTGSNSGIVSLTVGVTAAVLVSLYRRTGVVPALTALCLVIVAGVVAASQINLQSLEDRAHSSRYAIIRDGIGRGQTSTAQRGSLLQESMHLYAEGGPLGAGPVSTKTRLEAGMAPLVKEAHDDYMAALTERGAIGALGLVLLLGSILVRAGAVARTPPGSRPDEPLVNPNALVGALAGTLVTMTVYELLHTRHVWTLFSLVAAQAIWGRKWRGSEPS